VERVEHGGKLLEPRPGRLPTGSGPRRDRAAGRGASLREIHEVAGDGDEADNRTGVRIAARDADLGPRATVGVEPDRIGRELSKLGMVGATCTDLALSR
jgi:hypothetical protein